MTRSPVDAPITEDDAFLTAALEHASVPTLLMSILHLTGDAALLRGPIRPQRTMPGETDGGLSEADKVAVRAMALEALRAYRDRGCTLPPPPSAATIREMMSFMVGDEVPDEYVPMFLDEMALQTGDERRVAWDAVPRENRERFHVVVIGAGMSGLLTAIRLEQAGVPYVVIEKNQTLGGTWLENSYPGCRVDVANHFYCYSFEPNHDWSEFFSQRDELHDYFERCADRYGVRQRIRFGTEVVAAHWNDEEARWEVRLRTKDGEETLLANAVISAVGQLNRPRLPDIPGRETFAGPAFHSAQWQHQHDLHGKRVAVIGTGASAFQLAPEIAKQASRLVVFQRSPQWMVPNARYHARVFSSVRRRGNGRFAGRKSRSSSGLEIRDSDSKPTCEAQAPAAGIGHQVTLRFQQSRIIPSPPASSRSPRPGAGRGAGTIRCVRWWRATRDRRRGPAIGRDRGRRSVDRPGASSRSAPKPRGRRERRGRADRRGRRSVSSFGRAIA